MGTIAWFCSKDLPLFREIVRKYEGKYKEPAWIEKQEPGKEGDYVLCANGDYRDTYDKQFKIWYDITQNKTSTFYLKPPKLFNIKEYVI